MYHPAALRQILAGIHMRMFGYPISDIFDILLSKNWLKFENKETSSHKESKTSLSSQWSKDIGQIAIIYLQNI